MEIRVLVEMRNDRNKGGKKQNLPCNSICKKMGFACNLTVREQKHDQNTSVTCSEQSGFSLGQKQIFSKQILFWCQNLGRLQCYSLDWYKLSHFQSHGKIQSCGTRALMKRVIWPQKVQYFVRLTQDRHFSSHKASVASALQGKSHLKTQSCSKLFTSHPFSFLCLWHWVVHITTS